MSSFDVCGRETADASGPREKTEFQTYISSAYYPVVLQKVEPSSSVSDAPDMNKYSHRANSFKARTLSRNISPSEMAIAGFFWTGERDRVKCHSCKRILENWTDFDSAISEHTRYALNDCSYLSKLMKTINNVD
jgi:hypothetical protein